MTDELIAELVELAGNLASLVAGLPDEAVAQSLTRFRSTLEAEMSGLGSEAASLIADQFIAAVIKCKHGFEVGAGGQVVTLQ